MNSTQNALTSVTVNTPVTMSSVELVAYINELREAGKPELRHDNFMAKIEKHPGITSPKFLGHVLVPGPNGAMRESKCYHLPERECRLMVMSESLSVQTKVLDRLMELEAEAKVKQQPIPQLAPPVALLGMYLDAAKMFEIPLHIAQSEATKEVRLQLGYDFTSLLRLAPAQQNIQPEQMMLEPTEIGKRLGMSAVKLNRELESAGLQIKVDGSWQPTELGKSMCAVHHWVVGNKSGYNLKWNLSEVEHRVG